MSEYKRILVTIDFSDTTGQVVSQAKDIGARYGAELTLLHVVEYLPPLGFGDDPFPSPAWTLDEKNLLEGARGKLHAYAQQSKLSDAQHLVRLGTPKYEILRVAKEQGIDLIVVGTHGRHGLNRLLGSTADGVIHNTSCDVLAIRVTG